MYVSQVLKQFKYGFQDANSNETIMVSNDLLELFEECVRHYKLQEPNIRVFYKAETNPMFPYHVGDVLVSYRDDDMGEVRGYIVLN